MPGWKSIQSKKQRVRKTKIALICLGIILMLLILSQAVKFTRTLFSPWKVPIAKSFLWNGDFSLNFLVRSNKVSLVSFNPKEQKIVVFDIPDSVFLEVAHGFGNWQLSSIYNLGEGEQITGAVLLQDTLSDFFGLPIEGFLQFSGKYAEVSPQDLIAEFRGSPFSLVYLLPHLKTNFTPFELIHLKFGLSAVRFDKISQIDLENADVLEQTKLADGSLVYISEDQRVESILAEVIDPVIKSEHKTVAIFNSTNHPLLAQKAARIVTNIGGDVIIVTNGREKFKNTVVIGEQSQTLQRLWQIFGKFDNINPENEDLKVSRAQINVFLGEDFLRL